MRISGAAIVAATLLSPSAGAQQQRPLPAFAVATASGGALSSSRLNASDRWVLVYASPAATVSDRLLPSLEEWGDPARVVIVAAGPATSIDTGIRTRFRGNTPPAVYADPDGSAARALEITSVPALVGIERGSVDWIVQGVLNDPRMVESLVRNWLAGR